MDLKRKHEAISGITYGSEVTWLQALISRSARQSSDDNDDDDDDDDDDDNVRTRDPPIKAFRTGEEIIECAKIAYLIYHHLDAKEEILRLGGIFRDTAEYQHWSRQLSTKRGQWQGAVMNKFLLPHIKELQRRWLVAHPWRTFESLGEHERVKIWLEAYDADPKKMVGDMFKPFLGPLDVSNVFNSGLSSNVDKAKMGAVRIMLRNKYVFGCETTYARRVLAKKKEVCFGEWASYAKNPSLSHTIVDVADLPILWKQSSRGTDDNDSKRPRADPKHDGELSEEFLDDSISTLTSLFQASSE